MDIISKILIVDDDAHNIQVLATNLKIAGYQIIIARDGQQAVLAAREVKPDIILLDVMMPVMDGYQACKILKEDPETRNIPVLFLSAKDQVEDTVKAFDLGAVDYIIKPPNRHELLARVATHLDLKHKTDQLRVESQELREKNRKIQANLDLAREIQRQVMPVTPPRKGVAFHYSSTEEVGGDFFDFFPLDNDRLGIFISDVSGHGVAAAFITLLLKRTLHYEKDALNDPAVLLSTLNEVLYTESPHTFITAFYGIIDFTKPEMIYSVAGHNLPYIISDKNISLVESKYKSLPMGVIANDYLTEIGKCYKNDMLSFTHGSKLFLYTDGLSEAYRVNNKLAKPHFEDFETHRMEKVLRECVSLSSTEVVTKMINELTEFCQTSDFLDDVCIISIEIQK